MGAKPSLTRAVSPLSPLASSKPLDAPIISVPVPYHHRLLTSLATLSSPPPPSSASPTPAPHTCVDHYPLPDVILTIVFDYCSSTLLVLMNATSVDHDGAFFSDRNIYLFDPFSALAWSLHPTASVITAAATASPPLIRLPVHVPPCEYDGPCGLHHHQLYSVLPWERQVARLDLTALHHHTSLGTTTSAMLPLSSCDDPPSATSSRPSVTDAIPSQWQYWQQATFPDFPRGKMETMSCVTLDDSLYMYGHNDYGTAASRGTWLRRYDDVTDTWQAITVPSHRPPVPDDDPHFVHTPGGGYGTMIGVPTTTIATGYLLYVIDRTLRIGGKRMCTIMKFTPHVWPPSTSRRSTTSNEGASPPLVPAPSPPPALGPGPTDDNNTTSRDIPSRSDLGSWQTIDTISLSAQIKAMFVVPASLDVATVPDRAILLLHDNTIVEYSLHDHHLIEPIKPKWKIDGDAIGASFIYIPELGCIWHMNGRKRSRNLQRAQRLEYHTKKRVKMWSLDVMNPKSSWTLLPFRLPFRGYWSADIMPWNY